MNDLMREHKKDQVKLDSDGGDEIVNEHIGSDSNTDSGEEEMHPGQSKKNKEIAGQVTNPGATGANKPTAPQHHQIKAGINTIREFLVWNRSLSPADRKQKFCAMSTDAFSFYRGSNHIYFR